ncbi:MAG: DUF433 domain-containing protein [Ktedonobacterales bacterium]
MLYAERSRQEALLTTPTDIKYIVTDPNIYGGRPIVAGDRIAVIDIAVWTHQGMTPELIAQEYPLTLSEIHAALAYYYDHKDDLDERLAANEAMLAEYAANDHSPMMERIRILGIRASACSI